MFLRLFICYSRAPFLAVYGGNQTYSEWFAFVSGRTWSLITSSFTCLFSEVPGEALFLSQAFAFSGLKKFRFCPTKPTSRKKLLTPGVSHSHQVAVVEQTAFILCFLPDLCMQTPVPGSLSFVFCVSRREPGSGQCVLAWHWMTPALVSGSLPRFSSGPAFQGILVTAVAVLLRV